MTAIPNLDSTWATLVQLTHLVGLRVQTHVPTLSGSRLSSGIKLDEPSILYPFVRRPESVYALPCWTANDVARTWFLSISRLSRGSARALLYRCSMIGYTLMTRFSTKLTATAAYSPS